MGPSRSDWTDEEWGFARSAFDSLPEELKNRPELMIPLPLDDPSESIRSSAIRPILARHFEIAEERPYGGNILWFIFPCLDMERLRERLDGGALAPDRARGPPARAGLGRVLLSRDRSRGSDSASVLSDAVSPPRTRHPPRLRPRSLRAAARARPRLLLARVRARAPPLARDRAAACVASRIRCSPTRRRRARRRSFDTATSPAGFFWNPWISSGSIGPFHLAQGFLSPFVVLPSIAAAGSVDRDRNPLSEVQLRLSRGVALPEGTRGSRISPPRRARPPGRSRPGRRCGACGCRPPSRSRIPCFSRRSTAPSRRSVRRGPSRFAAAALPSLPRRRLPALDPLRRVRRRRSTPFFARRRRDGGSAEGAAAALARRGDRDRDPASLDPRVGALRRRVGIPAGPAKAWAAAFALPLRHLRLYLLPDYQGNTRRGDYRGVGWIPGDNYVETAAGVGSSPAGSRRSGSSRGSGGPSRAWAAASRRRRRNPALRRRLDSPARRDRSRSSTTLSSRGRRS